MSFHHHSRRDNPSSDTARVTIKKISLNPTSRRSSHALAVPGANSQRSAAASDQVTQVLGTHSPSAVEVGNCETTAVVPAVEDALGDALMRPGHVVMHLVLGQDGTQMALPHDQHAVQELPAQGYR